MFLGYWGCLLKQISSHQTPVFLSPSLLLPSHTQVYVFIFSPIHCLREMKMIFFSSQGFFNFTSRRPRHLLHILELGYNVMYNDVDMVWLADPFPYLQGNHDVYFTDDMAAVCTSTVFSSISFSFSSSAMLKWVAYSFLHINSNLLLFNLWIRKKRSIRVWEFFDEKCWRTFASWIFTIN